jgi:hypothetical protein
MRGAIPPLPQYAFMAWCLVKHRDNFTFTFYLVLVKFVILYLLIPSWSEKVKLGVCIMKPVSADVNLLLSVFLMGLESLPYGNTVFASA